MGVLNKVERGLASGKWKLHVELEKKKKKDRVGGSSTSSGKKQKQRRKERKRKQASKPNNPASPFLPQCAGLIPFWSLKLGVKQ